MAGMTSLQAARIQMAVSLGFHIVFAALAIGVPLLLLITEYRAIRNDDAVWMALTRRWSKALGILTTQTGGLLIQNTNDLVKGIQRINEDRRFHYLLGYTSTLATGASSPRRFDPAIVLWRSMLYLTAAASSFSPSWNVTPGRILSVSALLSADHS